jgi:hypothetical protein
MLRCHRLVEERARDLAHEVRRVAAVTAAAAAAAAATTATVSCATASLLLAKKLASCSGVGVESMLARERGGGCIVLVAFREVLEGEHRVERVVGLGNEQQAVDAVEHLADRRVSDPVAIEDGVTDLAV